MRHSLNQMYVRLSRLRIGHGGALERLPGIGGLQGLPFLSFPFGVTVDAEAGMTAHSQS